MQLFFQKKPKKPINTTKPSKVFRPKNNTISGATKIFAHSPSVPPPKRLKIPRAGGKITSVRDIARWVSLIPLYWQSIKLSLRSFNVVRYSYRFLLTTLLTLLVLFVTYLSLFDSTFYLKKYTIQTAPDSFLSDTSAQSLVDSLKKQNVAGFLPLNNYWFLNQNALNEVVTGQSPLSSLTLAAKTWPDSATLTVHTEPILATLAVQVDNTKEYLAIGQDGTTLGYDSAHLRTNLIDVLSPVIVTQKNSISTTLKLNQHPIQMQKIWFAKELRRWLTDLHISVASIAFSSLSDYDPDIVVTTSTGTLLLFDYQAFDQQLQRERIETTWKQTTLAKDEKNSLISYIDFRIEKRIFWCLKTEACSIDKNI
jgi:hypothetical protein